MSFTSVLNDSFKLKKNIDSETLVGNPELQQGKALLQRRSRMKKSIRIRSNDLMKEGFTNMTDSNFQQAVIDKNDSEMQDLIGMQNSYESTKKMWLTQYQDIIQQIKDKPEEYNECVKKCQQTKDEQLLSACLFGCNVGKILNSSSQGKDPKIAGDINKMSRQHGSIQNTKALRKIIDDHSNEINSSLETMTASFSKILKSLNNDPLVLEMKKTNISPNDLNGGLKQLETKWSQIFKASCDAGIGIGKNKDGTSKFIGHKQYCKSWTSTSNGRSGYFGDNYTIKSDGTKDIDNFEKSPTMLYNASAVGTQSDKDAGRFGCDVSIPGTAKNELGGAGYCTCVDGTTIYMDAGHPTVSCNDLCNPENVENKGSKNLFYHNPNNWTPSIKPLNASIATGVKAFNQKSDSTGAPWLQCGSDGGRAPECPNGMKQSGGWFWAKKSECGSYDSDPGWAFWEDDERLNVARKCVVPLPQGGDIKMKGGRVEDRGDNGMGLQIPKGYKKLPTPTELVDVCKDVKYANLYIEILKFRTLDIILNAKTKIMGKVIDNASKGINKIKLEQSITGKKLLRDMRKYKRIYDEMEINERRKNQLTGMYEDIHFKSQSANISYYIWFILAISGMLLVIKKLRSGNQS